MKKCLKIIQRCPDSRTHDETVGPVAGNLEGECHKIRSSYKLLVVAPVYDDAAAANQLVANLVEAFSRADVQLRIIFVDDGSPVPLSHQMRATTTAPIEVLRLRRNVGHQRAIALATAYVHEHVRCDAMLVMDADGEDRPEDAAALVARCRQQRGARIFFAERTRRSESALFQI